MKLKLATRVLNEEYFIDTFLEYYTNLGVDEIHIFDCSSFDNTLNIIKTWQAKNKDVILALSDKRFRHTSYINALNFCNYILQYAINNQIQSDEDSWWIFPDVDEFIRPPYERNVKKFLKECHNDLIRTVFIDWQLPPDLINQNLELRYILNNVRIGSFKGIVQKLYGDPFYKDYIINLTPHNVKTFEKLKTTAGFHRFILNDQIFLPPNEFLVVDHLRTVPFHICEKRIKRRLKLLQDDQNDWFLEHFLQLKQRLENYESFYRNANLNSFEELERLIKKVYGYDNQKSFFNNVIVREKIIKPRSTKTSIHDIIKKKE